VSGVSEAFFQVLVAGILLFIGASFIGQTPLVWGLGIVLVLGFWVYLASLLVERGAPYLSGASNPSVAAMGWSALLGALTGLVSAVAWIGINYLKVAFAGSVAGSNPVGSALGLFEGIFGMLIGGVGLLVWPAAGALVCGLFGAIWGARLTRT
jgi:hypothetical protein